MAATYRYARRYRYRPRYSPGRMSGKEIVAVVAVGASLALVSGRASTAHHGPVAAVQDAMQASPAGLRAVAFARSRIGCPYVWAGTGPCSAGYDCSGLMVEAYASAGMAIARTSQRQWATLPHIPASQARPGDLVFFAGSDGTETAPGHVAIYIGGGKVIQAWATGTNVMVSVIGHPGGIGGLTQPVGYARP